MDPFEDAVACLDASLIKACQLHTSIRNSGYVKEQDVNALAQELRSAHDELEILLDVMTALRSSNGRVGGGRGGALPAAVLVARQRRVTAVEDEYKDLMRGLEKLERGLSEHQKSVIEAAKNNNSAAAASNNKKNVLSSTMSNGDDVAQKQQQGKQGAAGRRGYGGDGDDFFNMQMETQQEEMSLQNAVLDRLHHNVITMKTTAVDVRDEVVAQEDALQRLHVVSDNLLSRIHVANQKVDVMLNSMSNKGKICLIVMLCLVLGIMIAVVFF